jgi:hypothetical protein
MSQGNLPPSGIWDDAAPPSTEPKPLSKGTRARLVVVRFFSSFSGVLTSLGFLQSIWRGFPKWFHSWEDTQFLFDMWSKAGGDFPMLMSLIASPLTGAGMIISGLVYYIFFKDRIEIGPKRTHAASFVGWSAVFVCAILISATFMFETFLSQTRIHLISDNADRHLNDIQKAKLKDAISPSISIFGRPITVFSADNPESNGYAIELMKELAKDGIKIQSLLPDMVAPFPMRALDTNVRGVFFQVKDRKNPSSEVRTLIWVLASAEIKATIWENSTLPSADNYILTIGLK